MVRWLSPAELVSAGLRVLLSGIFGAYADKREIQAALKECVPFVGHAERDEVWIDYVSDLGDGFDSTYTMACVLAADELAVSGQDGAGPVVTRRGHVLVMGGDQVYPTAGTDAYRDRLLGPYRAALPYTIDNHPDLFVVPGNHDWYDGLTSFLRVFCQGKWVGGRRTRQTRSYFALQLPNRWWLWGIDIRFDTYIDEPQLRFFTEEVPIQSGDSIIMCSAKPSWVKANTGDPEAFDTLDFFEREAIRKRGAQLRLSLAGDTHHYARYSDAINGTHRITAGGGGAYLSATHHLPPELIVPSPASKDPGKSPDAARFSLARSHPTKRASAWRHSLGVWRLWLKNPSFGAVVGALYVVYALIIQRDVTAEGTPWGAGLNELGYLDALTAVRSPAGVVLTIAVVTGLAGFTKSKTKAKKWALGVGHAAAHLAAVAGTVLLAASIADVARGHAFVATYLVLVQLLGGVLGSWVVAAYLLVADRVGCNTNELFAAQRIDDQKNFVRLRIRADGVLEVYPILVDRVGRRWKLRPSGEGEGNDPWFAAGRPWTPPALVEGPLLVEPDRSGSLL